MDSSSVIKDMMEHPDMKRTFAVVALFGAFAYQGVAPGESFYMNCMRVTGDNLAEKKCTSILGMTPCPTVHITDRMEKVTLKKWPF